MSIYLNKQLLLIFNDNILVKYVSLSKGVKIRSADMHLGLRGSTSQNCISKVSTRPIVINIKNHLL